MRMYLANHSSPEFHHLADKYPGKLGWLLTPKDFVRGSVDKKDWVPMAFDNGAFSAYQNNTDWDEKGWLKMLDKIEKLKIEPEWVLVPDCVGDKSETLKMFYAYRHYIEAKGFKTAYAVQDGCLPQDVPSTCSVVFVGGSLRWKWKTLEMWTTCFPRVHCGRVNRIGKLRSSLRLGVESVDGTGWFRRPKNEWFGDLDGFFSGEIDKQLELF